MEESNGKIDRFLSIPSLIAALTAFAYIFGSIYINKYYNFFGIPSGAIKLSAQDYMSHSLLPILLAVQIGLWAELLHYCIKHNYLFGFNLTKVGKIRKKLEEENGMSFRALVSAIYRDNPSETLMNISIVLSSLMFAISNLIITMTNYLNHQIMSGTTAVALFSSSIGILFFFSSQLLKFIFLRIMIFIQPHLSFGL